MKNKRKTIPEATRLTLFNQVKGVCPYCLNPLLHSKPGQGKHKSFQIAHIYPLNPTSSEINTLANVEKLHLDVDHENNLIALCPTCHTIFDTPRTVDDYLHLLRIKKDCLNKDTQRKFWHEFSIENKLGQIISDLSVSTEIVPSKKTDYDAKTVDIKMSDTDLLLKNKIKNNISLYYSFIKQRLALIDKANPETAKLIANRINAFYIKQAQLKVTQYDSFYNICDWINARTGSQNPDANEIIVSFFIQNCEVY